MSRISKSKYEEFIGKKFGRLTVIKFLDTTKSGHHLECKCDCGKTYRAIASRLRIGRTKSCGCIRIEKLRERLKIKPVNVLPPGEAALNYMRYVYKRSAFLRNLEFNLTLEQIHNIIISNCYYCNIIPMKEIHKGKNAKPLLGTFKVNGIDRKDSSKGYVIENCVSCCEYCNYAKRDLTEEDFLVWAKRIARHQETK